MKIKNFQIFFAAVLLLLSSYSSAIYAWGFYAHKKINKMAVFTLPPEMMVFYKKHIDLISETAVNPDKRRYVIEQEAARHYIDLDEYPNPSTLPHQWTAAKAHYSEDSLQAKGIVPWHIMLMKSMLTKAFKEGDSKQILRISADLGHYIADSNVPLHTCSNYNGQKTNQQGIHGLWETRLPELFSENYDFFVGKAVYLKTPSTTVWEHILQAHNCLDSVLTFEKQLSEKFPEDKKYSLDTRGTATIKTYSKEYAKSYHDLLNGQVERQMMASIKELGDMWYTCWVDAGSPDLRKLGGIETGSVVIEEETPKDNSIRHADRCTGEH